MWVVCTVVVRPLPGFVRRKAHEFFVPGPCSTGSVFRVPLVAVGRPRGLCRGLFPCPRVRDVAGALWCPGVCPARRVLATRQGRHVLRNQCRHVRNDRNEWHVLRNHCRHDRNVWHSMRQGRNDARNEWHSTWQGSGTTGKARGKGGILAGHMGCRSVVFRVLAVARAAWCLVLACFSRTERGKRHVQRHGREDDRHVQRHGSRG